MFSVSNFLENCVFKIALAIQHPWTFFMTFSEKKKKLGFVNDCVEFVDPCGEHFCINNIEYFNTQT